MGGVIANNGSLCEDKLVSCGLCGNEKIFIKLILGY